MRLCVCVCVCRGRCFHMGFPSSSAGRVCLQCRRPWFDSWVGKILWRRNRLPTPVFLGLPGVSHGKKSTRNAGDLSSIPGLGRSPGGRYSNPLQYSCLENPLGQRSLAGYSPWGLKETDVTKFSTYSTCFYIIKEKWMILISNYSVWSWAWQINFINQFKKYLLLLQCKRISMRYYKEYRDNQDRISEFRAPSPTPKLIQHFLLIFQSPFRLDIPFYSLERFILRLILESSTTFFVCISLKWGYSTFNYWKLCF